MAKGKKVEPAKVIVASNKTGKKIVDTKVSRQQLAMKYSEARTARSNAISSIYNKAKKA